LKNWILGKKTGLDFGKPGCKTSLLKPGGGWGSYKENSSSGEDILLFFLLGENFIIESPFFLKRVFLYFWGKKRGFCAVSLERGGFPPTGGWVVINKTS